MVIQYFNGWETTPVPYRVDHVEEMLHIGSNYTLSKEVVCQEDRYKIVGLTLRELDLEDADFVSRAGRRYHKYTLRKLSGVAWAV